MQAIWREIGSILRDDLQDGKTIFVNGKEKVILKWIYHSLEVITILRNWLYRSLPASLILTRSRLQIRNEYKIFKYKSESEKIAPQLVVDDSTFLEHNPVRSSTFVFQISHFIPPIVISVNKTCIWSKLKLIYCSLGIITIIWSSSPLRRW